MFTVSCKDQKLGELMLDDGIVIQSNNDKAAVHVKTKSGKYLLHWYKMRRDALVAVFQKKIEQKPTVL